MKPQTDKPSTKPKPAPKRPAQPPPKRIPARDGLAKFARSIKTL